VNPTRDLLIGFIGIIGIIGLGAMLLLFGEIRFKQPEQYSVIFALDNAAGLGAGSPVSMNGVEIGRVESTMTALDPQEGVLLELSVLDSVRIPRDVRVSIATSFVGDTRLSLRTTPRLPNAPDPGYLDPGETLETSAGELLDEIASLLDERISTFSRTAESIEEMAATFTSVGRRLDTLLATAENPDGTPLNLSESVRKVDQMVTEALELLADEGIRSQIDTLASEATETLEAVRSTASSWDQAAIDLSNEVQQASGSVDEATIAFIESSQQLNSALRSLQDITEQVNRGQGTLGMLLSNPDLYRSVNDAAVRLERVLREAQLLLEKYRREGIPINL
jgi:phospholipid/cholesterol/gamma-HCH transport system substrate-binding protein